ncbi:hypothetical protein [Frondihabitans peucedani]|uniref:Uncharacterized protein n=1 Tax=Frondihabitans peucedani TaxID=598626 RepID=A0ABP8E415_9MICO
MARERDPRRIALVVCAAIGVAGVAVTVVVRVAVSRMFESGSPVRYSTRPPGLDVFERINILSSVGLAALVVAIAALTAVVVLALRIARSR